MSKLPLLQQRIREKIQYAKDEMFPGHNRIYLEALRIEIETLNWVLNEISREIKTPHRDKGVE